MKNFRLQCVLRVLVIGLLMLISLYLFSVSASYVAAVIVSAGAAFQLHLLITYVEKTNRDLARFLRSIRYSDFSQVYSSEGRGASFEDVSGAFREVIGTFHAERAEKEESYRYLQTVVQHIGIGLISFKRDGTVSLVNTAAKRLIRVNHLKNISALSNFSRELVEVLFRLRTGEKALVQVLDNDELLQLVVYATEFKLRGELYTLASIQNIQRELEDNEMAAWQKLTRVLTHEIMNSITPIASLSSTIRDMLADTRTLPDELDSEVTETLGDVREAVCTIERRSQNLLKFVNNYRSLTRIPRPEYRIFSVAELFGSVALLLRPQMEAKNIRFVCSIDPERLDLTGDPELIEQVLINLLKNAMESVESAFKREIQLLARLDERGSVILQVVDNGPGIVQEAIDKIFIPFYTTKKEGSGIGLSLSRQIMRQHGGTISVSSIPETQTVFTLRF